MEVVRTYADHGKSGLSLASRLGLKQLLADAVGPDADFRAVLVYDVSRWGRFQNPDKGASYEYGLHLANIPIHYCAEQFANDGSLASSILKTLKRGMAGEYSRELSVKTWAGQRRLAELGFHIGGHPGYGLRRQLVGHDRAPKQILSPGEIKGLQSDHVVLIPGPAHELQTIRRIYRMYVDDGLSEREIAERLNAAKIPWIGSAPWTRMCIRRILMSPKYAGWSVYNRTSFKLQKAFIRNPREEWVWCRNAFEPVVSKKRFEQARQTAALRVHDSSDRILIDKLVAFIKREGRVSERLIESTVGMPSPTTYINHFGSLRNAYRLAGWKPAKQEHFLAVNRAVIEHREAIVAELLQSLAGCGARVTQDKRTCLLTTDCGIAMSLVVTRCTPSRQHIYWTVHSRESVRAHLRIVARLTKANDTVLDYYIFPNGIITNSRITLGAVNSVALNVHRYQTLDCIPALLRRTEVDAHTTHLFGLGSIPESSAARTTALPALWEIRRAMATLLADDDFRTLLRADTDALIPEVLWRLPPFQAEQRLALAICEEYVRRIMAIESIRRYVERRHGDVLGSIASAMRC
jgi:DNA invertase Pin-like site-specific DNA recombinase